MELNALIWAMRAHVARRPAELTVLLTSLCACVSNSGVSSRSRCSCDAGEQGRLHHGRPGRAFEEEYPTIEGNTEVPSAQGVPPPKTQPRLPLHNIMFPVAGATVLRSRSVRRRTVGPSLYLCEQVQQ
jgi:hypothetical protein